MGAAAVAMERSEPSFNLISSSGIKRLQVRVAISFEMRKTRIGTPDSLQKIGRWPAGKPQAF